MTIDEISLIWNEFDLAITDITYTMDLTGGALRMFRDHILELLQPTETVPDPGLLLTNGPPDDPATFVTGRWTRSKIEANLIENGPTYVLLSQQWAAFAYSLWEEDCRPRLAECLKIDKNMIKSEIFGDLRKIRHDIIHHRGVASAANSGKAKVLTWFRDGDKIYINNSHIQQFYRTYRASVFVDPSAMTPEVRSVLVGLEQRAISTTPRSAAS